MTGTAVCSLLLLSTRVDLASRCSSHGNAVPLLAMRKRVCQGSCARCRHSAWPRGLAGSPGAEPPSMQSYHGWQWALQEWWCDACLQCAQQGGGGEVVHEGVVLRPLQQLGPEHQGWGLRPQQHLPHQCVQPLHCLHRHDVMNLAEPKSRRLLERFV